MILNTFQSRDLLIDAYKFYSRGDARAKLALDIVKKRDDMFDAVKGCLDRAIKEEDVGRQALFLKAACFGMKFCPGVAIDEYPAACRLVRVLNILRGLNIDTNVGLSEAIDMLVSWKKFQLALWIVKYLGLDGEQQIVRKRCEHLISQQQLKDEHVAEIIQEILGNNPVVPYAEIADKAIESNRTHLALKLIEKESQSYQQIPLLMRLKRNDLSIAQALSSCDSNLIYMTIFKLKDSVSSEIPFLEMLKKNKLAFRYYCNYLAAVDLPKLIMISHKENPEEELICCLLDGRMESAFNVSKTRRDIVPQQIEVSIRLTKFQQGLRLGSTWIGLSISSTITNLIATNQIAKAKDAQRRFDVTDRKFKVLEQIATNTLPRLTVRDD